MGIVYRKQYSYYLTTRNGEQKHEFPLALSTTANLFFHVF